MQPLRSLPLSPLDPVELLHTLCLSLSSMQDKRAKGLRDLLMTMVISFPALINVGSLLGLLIFMSAAGRMPMPVPALLLPPNARPEPSRRYAVLGVQLFTFVRHDDEILTDDRNFDDFGHALLTLFQVGSRSLPRISLTSLESSRDSPRSTRLQSVTGDNWSAMMHACSTHPHDGSGCTEKAGDCGSFYAAVLFFVSFQFLGSFVFLNLVRFAYLAPQLRRLSCAESRPSLMAGGRGHPRELHHAGQCHSHPRLAKRH